MRGFGAACVENGLSFADEERRALVVEAVGATPAAASAAPRWRRVAVAVAAGLAGAALLALPKARPWLVSGRGDDDGGSARDAEPLEGGGEAFISETDQGWTIEDMRASMHPNLDGFLESTVVIGRDREICLQPTTGVAHPWERVSGGDWCATWREQYWDGLDIRHGWEYVYNDDPYQTPCGYHCCRRWIHGRPEKGGGLHVRMWPCSAGDQDQLFLLPRSGKGPIRLKRFPNRCLTVSSQPVWPVGDSGDGHQLLLWFCGHNDWNGQMWEVPLEGEGPIRWSTNPQKCLDGGRLEAFKKLSAKMQIMECSPGVDVIAQQVFLVETLLVDQPDPPEDSSRNSCKESTWPSRLDNSICEECSVPVVFSADVKNCNGYCKSVGRYCESAAVSDSGCARLYEMHCNDEVKAPYHAVCRCGEKFLRGQYGSLSEFWLTETEIRQRVREMADNFGIMEFQFYDAWEGFSHPPHADKDSWNCKIQGRPVHKATLEAAVDEIRNLEGRAWLAVHAAATNPNDWELTSGQWVMPPADVVNELDTVYFEASQRRLAAFGNAQYDQTYEATCGCNVGEEAEVADEAKVLDTETRIMDVVDMNPAWATRIVPQWAAWAADLGFSGIHWDTFGDFGHYDEVNGPKNVFRNDKGAPKPDIAGFLRAAMPILRQHGLLQTLNFVNGFGWDPVMLAPERLSSWAGEVGRLVAFPYWEVWSVGKEKEYFDGVAKDARGSVLAMYPGYSKYHCCLKNERQNAAEYGVRPFDLGLRRWKKAVQSGSTYHLITDGARYLQGPFIPDALQLNLEQVEELQTFMNADHPGAKHFAYMYAVAVNGSLLRQPLLMMTPGTQWRLVSAEPKVVHATIDHDVIYAVTDQHRVVSTHISLLDSWTLASAGDVISIAITGDTIYGVTLDFQLVKQPLAGMTIFSGWSVITGVPSGMKVSSIFIYGRTMYGVDEAGRVLTKSLSHLEDEWKVISVSGLTLRISSVVRYGDTIWGSTASGIVMQRFSTMNLDTPWYPTSVGAVTSIALLSEATR